MRFPAAFLFLFAASSLYGCGGDDPAATTSTSSGSGGQGGSGGSGGGGGAAPTQLTLQFEARVGAQPFSCGDTYTGLGTASTGLKLADFRFYLHDIRLHESGGGDVPVELDQDGLWQYQNLALLDFEDKTGSCSNGTSETNKAVHVTVPAGTYDGISFKLGVPFELNHGDAASAPSPLNLSGLFWGWNGGYKFLRIDGVPASAGGTPFNVHLGSTGCVGGNSVTSCSRPNVPEITLSGFDPTSGKIVVDYAALVAGSDLSKNGGGAPGCLSDKADPECAAVFERLGIDIADGSLHPDMQTLFKVE